MLEILSFLRTSAKSIKRQKNGLYAVRNAKVGSSILLRSTKCKKASLALAFLRLPPSCGD
jgi:hypothetical protein